MEAGEPMEVDHDDLVTIVNASKTRLKNAESQYMHRGTSVDLYKFSYKKRGWEHGHIFHANNVEDLSFPGIIGDIRAPNNINKRAARFLVLEPDQQESAENMMERSSSLKHVGVLKPYVAGFNTQISKVVSGFNVPTSPLLEWLHKNKPAQASSISIEVQQLIRTGYLAIEMIWSQGSTSDDLAYPGPYRTIDDRIKINPLCTRKRREGENDKMPLRRAYGEMIRKYILTSWRDAELEDFIVLLGTPAASEPSDVLGHPVLLLPAGRELLYHKFDRETLTGKQKRWLEDNAHPGSRWKEVAASVDKTLKKIINFQEEQDKKKNKKKQAEADDEGEQAEADEGEQQAVGFTPDFAGALHFASVATAHYHKHFKDTAQDKWRVAIKGRVDSLLKTVLPRLLSRRYNAKYVAAKVFASEYNSIAVKN